MFEMRLLIASCLALAVSAPACGSSGGGGSAAFVGNWSCTIPASTSTFTLVVVENADGSVTATASGGTGLQCSLKYTVQGNTATVESGQTCMTATITQGTATIGGTTLTGSLSGTQTFQGMPLTATETYSCSKH